MPGLLPLPLWFSFISELPLEAKTISRECVARSSSVTRHLGSGDWTQELDIGELDIGHTRSLCFSQSLKKRDLSVSLLSICQP